MLKKLVMKNNVNTGVFCVLAIIVNFALYNIVHVLLQHMGMEQRLAETIGRLLACVVILLLYTQVLDIKSMGMQKQNFFKGLFTGIFLFLVLLGNLIDVLAGLSEYSVVRPAAYLIIMVIVEQIFVGIFEEFLFRGLVLRTILAKFGENQYKNKMTAVVLSSILFGVIHFLNLFDTPELVNATTEQVFFAMFSGMFLGVLYLRTNNIWLVSFYHTLTNLVGELPVIFYDIPPEIASEKLVDVPVSQAAQGILLNAVFVVAALFLARKLKSEPASD